MDKDLKKRLVRIAVIGQQLIEGAGERELNDVLEDLGNELRALSGVCDVCDGSGIHPGEDPEDVDGETPLSRCPNCFGEGTFEPQIIAMLDFNTMSRVELSSWYIETVGYDLGEEDPSMSLEAYRAICSELYELHNTQEE